MKKGVLFTEHLWATASAKLISQHPLKETSNEVSSISKSNSDIADISFTTIAVKNQTETKVTLVIIRRLMIETGDKYIECWAENMKLKNDYKIWL